MCACVICLCLCAAAVLDHTASQDRFLAAHTRWLLRELRLVAYAQFLQPYRSVTLASMSTAFGVSTALLDQYVCLSSSFLFVCCVLQCAVCTGGIGLSRCACGFSLHRVWCPRDLAQFIYAGRLDCKIDKVGGVIATLRPDARNAQYAAVLKDGDALLNRVQKLSRVVGY